MISVSVLGGLHVRLYSRIRLKTLLFVSCVFSLLLNHFVPAAWSAANPERLKVGFIIVGPVNDMGWNWAQEPL